jgi:hypothetical protein
MRAPENPPGSARDALARIAARAPAAGRRLRDLAPLVGLWIVVGVYYVFVVSAGHFTDWHVWSSFYDSQANGILRGHLYLPEAPSRALMALKNPFDRANMQFWRWDHSYYQGHLYLYWGLVPAFIVAAIKRVTHVGGVPDVSLTFGFIMLRLMAGTLLIRAVARDAARRPPRWAVALAMLVFALANPTPYSLARGAVYEAAIMGGAAFAFAGLYLGYRALAARRTGAATAWLAGASFSFALAGGSRLSMLPTITALVVLTGAWCLWEHRRTIDPRPGRPRRWLPIVAATFLPAGAIGIALLLANYFRFGHWTEFGRSYVMTYPYFVAGLRFLAPNFYGYALEPPEWSCRFPFLSSGWGAQRPSVPGWLPVSWPPDHYSAEPTIGLLIAAPFTVFAAVAVIAALGRARLATLLSPTSTLTAASASAWMTRRKWLLCALALYILGAGPFLILNVTTMRYEHDFASGVMLVAIFGGWWLLRAPATARGRRAAAWLYALLAVMTIAAGVLLGFGGYFKHFERHNPALMHKLVSKLSVCPSK